MATPGTVRSISTRKSTTVWLIGQQSPEIPGNKLPSKREVMAYFFHLHLSEKKTIRESATLTSEAAKGIWDKARIPTRHLKHVIPLIEKIFQNWQKLKKNQNNKIKRSSTLYEKETAFDNSLDNLFDIAHAGALSMIKIEDQEFLKAQREPGRRGKMVGVDKALADREVRTMKRTKKFQDRLEKCKKDAESKSVGLCYSSSSIDSEEVDSDSHKMETGTSASASSELKLATAQKRKRGRKEIVTPELAAVDRTKVSHRNATALLYSVGESLGQDMTQFSVNRSSIRRSRIQHREAAASHIMSEFNPAVPLVVHWDGKLLPDLIGKETVDRLPILVTGDGVDKLLGVPKLAAGTGLEMGKAVIETLEQWSLSEKVKGMCFDTTASNTGRKNGACILIEQKLDKDLLYFPCRHHIFELVLESVFSVTLSPSASPEILLFKRFQAAWPSLDKSSYRTALQDEFTATAIADIREEVIAFATNQLNQQQPRDDYRELLEISMIFLGSKPPRGIHFRAPGAMHKARWMAKAIYAIKLWMLKGQFRLTKKEETGIRDTTLFVVRFYLKAWFQAPLPIAAPLNDLFLLKTLQQYSTTNSTVADAALKKFTGHLWYLSEELVALAFFDKRVPAETKTKMILSLQNEGTEDLPKRATIANESILEKTLDNFVTTNTSKFFSILGLDSKFTELDPEIWSLDDNYIAAEKCISSVKCVNDTAERGVALIEEYNRLHTQDEQQKQFLLQVVNDHRKRFPDFRKETLSTEK